MHEAFWNGLYDSRWEQAPLGAEAIRLVLWLRKRGYGERSRRTYAHAVVHLGRVLHAERSPCAARDLDEAVVAKFVGHHLPTCSCFQRRTSRRPEQIRRGLSLLLEMLREEGTIAARVAEETPLHQALLDGYCRFLRDDRGLANTTTINYRRYLRDFLVSRGDALSPHQLVALTEEALLAFCQRRGERLGATAWNHMASALTGFYRWLDLHGHGGNHLIDAVPFRRRYRLADVPCALAWEQVQRLLAAVDRRAINGKRNYAMLLLIATYGLRGCEVRALRLDSIDWSGEEITVFSPKTGRSRKLPLTPQAGEAVLQYLREERPASRHREVFLSSCPPHGPLQGKLNQWLARCFESAGIEATRKGAHTLRHSVALQMLRGGETLKGIGDVLGHRSPESTFIYTKVHIEDLRTVALDPEVVS
jgi:site-specific recombinase XerD